MYKFEDFDLGWRKTHYIKHGYTPLQNYTVISKILDNDTIVENPDYAEHPIQHRYENWQFVQLKRLVRAEVSI